MNENQINVLQSPNESQPVRLTASGGDDSREMPAIPSTLVDPARARLRHFSGNGFCPSTFGRPASIKLLDETLPQSKIIGLLTQRDENKEEPEPQDLYQSGRRRLS